MTVDEFRTLKALEAAEKKDPYTGATVAQVRAQNGASGLPGPTLARLAARKFVRALSAEDGTRYVRTARGRRVTED